VLGPEKALSLANEKGLAVYLLVRNDSGGFDELRSNRFSERETKQ